MASAGQNVEAIFSGDESSSDAMRPAVERVTNQTDSSGISTAPGRISIDKLKIRQQGPQDRPYDHKAQTSKKQGRQILTKHQLRHAPQPLMPRELYPGSPAFTADVFRIAVPVAIFAFNSSTAGGTNSRHIWTGRRIGGFAHLLIGTQLKCTCLDARFVAHVRMSQLNHASPPCQTHLLSR